MKLPSINLLYLGAKKSLFQFPLTIISAILGVVVSIYLVENEIDNMFPYINFLLTAALGIPLFFCTSIYCTMEKAAKAKKTIVHAMAFVFLIAIYYSLPSSETTNNTSIPYIKYTIYNIIIHLLVSFIPYIKTKRLNGFWNYNKSLFIRVWTSILYSGVLYLGLIFALFSIDKLFNMDFHNDLYFDIFIVIAGIFNTWFFVSGIPDDLQQLEHETNYPKGLKIFTQYILLPLLILYLCILYVYVFKIVIRWDWPKGIVSYLISGVSILGILAFLLIYPYSKSNENSWIHKFSRLYYFILIPLIIVLFLAIEMRIEAYGITINRYLIILLGLWLSIISIYFAIDRKNIKLIPQSLAVILSLMSFGPWGIFSVSENSQSNRLKTILEKHQILANGAIQNEATWSLGENNKLETKTTEKNQHLVTDSIHNEIYSIVNYLDNHHGFHSIAPLFEQNLDSIFKLKKEESKYYKETRFYLQSLGLKPRKIYRSNYSNNYIKFSRKNSQLSQVTGYDYLFNYQVYNGRRKEKIINSNNLNLKVSVQKDDQLIIKVNNDTLFFETQKLQNQLFKKYGKNSKENLTDKELTLVDKTENFFIKFEITNISFKQKESHYKLHTINGKFYIRKLKSNDHRQ